MIRVVQKQVRMHTQVRDGQYRGIATWRYDQDRQRLIGTIEVPMTLAIVGSGTKVLPIAKASLELLNVDP